MNQSAWIRDVYRTRKARITEKPQSSITPQFKTAYHITLPFVHSIMIELQELHSLRLDILDTYHDTIKWLFEQLNLTPMWRYRGIRRHLTKSYQNLCGTG